jgi:2-methylcitrate dehydratase PrpD
MLAPITMEKLLDLAAVADGSIPQDARAMARLSLFDWLTVARAGADQPLSRIVRDFVAEEGGRPSASVVGLAARVPPRAAALANGTISHALDYDDTHFAHVGHPSVVVLPAALALGEANEVRASAVLDAFLLGAEASIRIGIVLGRPHYDRGFHQTATAGAFGATVAAARVLSLSRDATRQALSLVSTRASGLKSQFGSMGKPYNAGLAAANGVEAAELARRGFVSCDDGVGGLQGFVDTHADAVFEAQAWSAPPGTFLLEDIKHKLHACCHGLHAAIEALRDARERGVDPARVAQVSIRTNPRWLRVCNIKEPRTGLEAKFSYAMVSAMTLYAVDTAADDVYTEALCRDPRLVALGKRVEVHGEEAIGDTAASVRVELSDGSTVDASHDLSARRPAEALAQGLRAKARALLGEATAERLWSGVAAVQDLSAREVAHLLNG